MPAKLFYILLVAGLVPLSLSWERPVWRWATLVYDVLLIVAAVLDWRRSQWPEDVQIEREIVGRMQIGAASEVRINLTNHSPRNFTLRLKDEYPPEMTLQGAREATLELDAMRTAQVIYGVIPPRRGRFEFGRVAVRHLSRWRLVWRQTERGEPQTVKVYPNLRRAREAELKALGAQSLVAAHRRGHMRGEGREFESLRDYVPGDELRHVSWTATARRGRMVTRQYQIERDQTVIVALDAGRLMTARIERETKLDAGVNATLALMSAAARGGDNAGLLVFGRGVKAYLPPNRGREQTEAALETLHGVEAEMIEPSYTRAFEFISAKCKRRALVVVLTDLVDREGSRELLQSLKLLRPRHLPLVVTIGDRDLQAAVREPPGTLRELFVQSVAEEIMRQRAAALRHVETQGGLALDVNAAALAPALLETYLRIKERGLL